MGQQICYIITPVVVNVPIDIVHFKEENCIVIPLLADDGDYENMLQFSNPQTVNEFLNEFETHLGYEYLNRKVFDFISKSRLSSFGMINFGNFKTHGENFPFLFIDSDNVPIPWEHSEQKTHDMLGIRFTFRTLINNETKYRSFYSAEEFYFKELEKKCR